MAERKYISVILPLRLEWEPCYWTTEEDVAVGDAVTVPVKEKEYVGVVSAVGVAPTVAPAKIKEIVCLEKELPRVSAEEIALWGKLAEYYMCTVGEVYKSAYTQEKIRSEHKIAEKKAKTAEKEDVSDTGKRGKSAKKGKCGKNTGEKDKSGLETLKEGTEKVKLSEAQKKAEEEILEAFAQGKTALLNGVTGSGKTEIYMSLAIRALSAGKNVLYLVPEIVLSRQLETRMREVFGNMLLVFHSGETPAKRQAVISAVRAAKTSNFHNISINVIDKSQINGSNQENLDRKIDLNEDIAIRREGNLKIKGNEGIIGENNEIQEDNTNGGGEVERGSGYIVLGTRSAVFLPHNSLGLIIIDEEQDPSFKQDAPAPHYNGRDAALMLGSLHGPSCNVVLGSATPSLESLYNCMSGKYKEVNLTERYYGTDGPEIEIIDTNAERRKRGMVGSFSRKLIARIKKCLKEGGQVMILRTRRGYSPVLQCSECGHILRCPHCNISLTYHKDDEKLRCHHCGHSTALPDACPKCGGKMTALGAGVEKVEEEAASLFPTARIARLDSDVMQSKRAEKDIISRFSKGEIDILIGTQVVAKGFDFDKLRLTAILQSDTLLSIRDFRADEKALQTLIQFSGRCGRRNQRGSLVIQTAQPNHPVYANLSAMNDNNKGYPTSNISPATDNIDKGSFSVHNTSEENDSDRNPALEKGNTQNIVLGTDSDRNLPPEKGDTQNIVLGNGFDRNLTPEKGNTQNIVHGNGSDRNLTPENRPSLNIFDTLLAERKEFGYPPFTRLIYIYVRHKSEDAAENLTKKLVAELAEFNAEGPATPSIDKDADQYVRYLRLTLPRDKELARRKRALLKKISAFELKENCPFAITIDVDPA